MSNFAYCAWRFNLWTQNLPTLNTYNSIDDWVARRVIKPGEMPTKEEWEERLNEWYKNPDNERAFREAERAAAGLG
jgi:hypothetical protein